MIFLLVWMLVSYGATMIVAESKIMSPLRGHFHCESTMGRFVRCPMCVGFWIGVLLSLSHFGLTATVTSPTWPWRHLFDGFASSAWCWIVYVVLRRLGSREL
jgi:hypothetical protein